MGMGRDMLEQAMFEDFCNQQDNPWNEDFVPTTWTTNDGQTLFLKDMTTDHINNCIKWLKANRADNLMMPRMVAAFEAELATRQPKPAKYYSLD